MVPVFVIPNYTRSASKGLRTRTNLFMKGNLPAFPVLKVNKSISAYLPAGRCDLARQNSLRYSSDLKILNSRTIINIEGKYSNERTL